jgi:hypothetical protein
MSQKSKTPSVTIPEAYQLLNLPLKKESALRKIIIDPTGTIHALQSSDTPVPADITIDVEFKSFNDFITRPEQTILAYHEQFFKCEPPKKQSKVTTATYIWAYLIKEAKPRLDNTKKDGTKERKSSIAGRLYLPGTEDHTKILLKTPQARICLAIFHDLLKSLSKPSVTEAELKAEVYRRQADLKTRQDAWRIFQYYRPQLIQAKLIRCD